jgi:hypothetical protein
VVPNLRKGGTAEIISAEAVAKEVEDEVEKQTAEQDERELKKEIELNWEGDGKQVINMGSQTCSVWTTRSKPFFFVNDYIF